MEHYHVRRTSYLYLDLKCMREIPSYLGTQPA